MKWNFKGQHQGDDVNDIPDGYLKWMVGNSSNEDASAMADKILKYRKSKGFSVDEKGKQSGGGTTSPKSGGGRDLPSSHDRAEALKIAIMMNPDEPKNAFSYVKPILDFIVKGTHPSIQSMLIDDEGDDGVSEPTSEEPSKGDPFLSELDDDEIPF